MSVTQHVRLVALLMVAAVVTTACGTRADDSEFQALMGGVADTPGGGAAVGDSDGFGTAGSDGGAGLGSSGDTGEGGLSSAGGAATGGGATDAGSTSGSGSAGGGGSTAGGSGSGGGGGSTGGNSTDGGGGGGQQANQASDVGVTKDAIKVGNIVSLSGPIGANAFAPTYFGAKAYFEYANEAEGGINGRQVQFVSCDDAEDQGRNQECAQKLVEDEKVFAFVANSTRAYAGAEYVADNGVPDILGQPIGNAYWTYPTFVALRGSEYKQDGTLGYKGKLYGTTLQHEWFKENLEISTAAVLYYNIPASKQFGLHQADALRSIGIKVVEFEVNPAFPNFDSVVARMKQEGVEATWDTLDTNGNRNLCQAMDRNNFTVKARTTTSQGMGRGIGQYSSPCRLSIYGITESIPYSETSNPEVKLFQDVMKRVYGDRFEDDLAQWAWEGWLAAKSFSEAVGSMGAAPTRKGLVEYYRNVKDYTLGGLFSPLEWTFVDYDSIDSIRTCAIISKWNEEKFDFERVSPNPYCKDVKFLSYEPA